MVNLGKQSGQINGYSLSDLIVEKLRALLQQEKRNRNRRQDVYDINSLVTRFELNDSEKQKLLALLIEKCEARDITPNVDSMAQPEIRERSHKEWQTMELEIGELPDFDECFGRVDGLYRSLPW